jgi:hypothetical protein
MQGSERGEERGPGTCRGTGNVQGMARSTYYR